MKVDITINDLESSINPLCEDLEALLKTPGPTYLIAKISDKDVRIGKNKDFPIAQKVREIVGKINKKEDTDLKVITHNGNVVVVGGLGFNPSDEEIKDIPVTLGAHLDEISYMVSKPKPELKGKRELLPLHAADKRFFNDIEKQVKILGFRGDGEERNFVEITKGKIASLEEITDRGEIKRYCYVLEAESDDVKEGDIAIQDYGPAWLPEKKFGANAILRCKALDDRVGSIAVIYAIKELAKYGIPTKGILTGGEEGVPLDISWDRLIRPTFKKYCHRDGIFIICDGIDGSALSEFKNGTYLREAVLVPYTAYGKGPGDLGIFSLLRDNVSALASSKGFQVATTTNYVSRSTGIKIMDDYPLVGYIDWTNGITGHPKSICHVDEKILIQQIINIIGTMVYTVEYFTDMYSNRPRIQT